MIENILFEYMDGLVKRTPTDFVRYMYDEVNWDSRLLGIMGPRGVGKSTMLLQRIMRVKGAMQLYVSADHMFFVNHRLEDVIDDFVKEGGTHLYIDEVHKYPAWSRVLKQAYDVYPDLHLVFTGSSVLDIRRGEADLSRRALLYDMQGLSFREYLRLFHKVGSPAYSLDDIVGGRVELPDVQHPLPLFRDYLSRGYYPFAVEGDFQRRLFQVVEQTMDVDIPQYADMKATTARKLKQLLLTISKLAPYKPVADSLSAAIGVSKNNVPDYLLWLERAGMIGLLRDDTSGLRGMGKVEKAYVDNPSLMSVLAAGSPDVGGLRETFFYNQMRVRHAITASRRADFVVDGMTFEVGGKNKGGRQLREVPGGYIVRDDIEIGHGNVIPLWNFGMNY